MQPKTCIIRQPRLDTLGEQLRKHRLELLWLQTDVTAKIGVSSASVSDWERGITSPSRRLTKKIQEFPGYTPKALVRKKRCPNSYCLTCGIFEASSERCLFEAVCKLFNKSSM
jgi:transcriptional regulator with XRE-family HTH domain